MPVIQSPSDSPSLCMTDPSELAARCHEIQTGLGFTEVPEFERLRLVGMAVRLALHIQGLPTINYETLKLVASHYLSIPSLSLKNVLEFLADVEFVKLYTEGKVIKSVIPNVPYYETLYSTLGSHGIEGGFNEAEQLSIEILCRLSKTPEKIDNLKTTIGADANLIDRVISVGKHGSYVRVYRSRGRDIALTPNYFSENSEIYADIVAGSGSAQVTRLLSCIQQAQGTPLSIILKRKEIAGVTLDDAQLKLLTRLAQDGVIKPPSIVTPHSGENFFLFTPRPAGAALAPTKRDIYEKAMAIVAAIRQGQFLPARYAIRSPGAVLCTLKNGLRLGKATTEANHQYMKLVFLRVANLIDVGGGFSELRIIDTRENREALQIAYDMVNSGATTGMEVDESVREVLQSDQSYVESIIASGRLQKSEVVDLTSEQQSEMDNLFNR